VAELAAELSACQLLSGTENFTIEFVEEDAGRKEAIFNAQEQFLTERPKDVPVAI
jgi:hypothetical protein